MIDNLIGLLVLNSNTWKRLTWKHLIEQTNDQK